ncbi:MAG: tRNA pseudouridine(38-40) synthase TruA [Methylophilaceae bacterium 17-44-8]|nr:MAG: tRNA pseudouridine(38-40) synthase TruA [Methylophilales bacterium 28-44-11]OYZ03315.1 MAG: tRNA pseudouridine(38-40) synthase TruA [Methylophilales bacterium 16-45-7]OZA06801.1 MAG: tRNA pseudouridine(38-40) synthase TruA [Methylophilaceae bacterium 17-44-8]
MRIALGVEYNGACYCGWQSQPNGQSVQDELELAIQSIALHPVRIHAAGRTDAGVHALMQVIHFETSALRPMTAWVRGVNAYLPATIRVLWAHTVDENFHARFSAVQRSYQYVLLNQSQSSAISYDRVGWYHHALSLDLMQTGITYLLGEHDFSAFRASECQAKSAIKHMTRAEVRKVGDYFLFDFSANAFLQHQVRNMVGALVYIGSGKLPTESMQTLLQQADRTLSPPTFSPNGLYLSGVRYHEQWQLPNTHRQLSLL